MPGAAGRDEEKKFLAEKVVKDLIVDAAQSGSSTTASCHRPGRTLILPLPTVDPKSVWNFPPQTAACNTHQKTKESY